MIATEEVFDEVAQEVLKWPSTRRWESKDKDSRIRAMFGAPLNVIADIWNRVWKKLSNAERDSLINDSVKYKYLLYALVFLKVYATTTAHCSMVDWPSEKTFRKWSWYFVKKISELKSDVIKLKNRFLGFEKGETVHTNCFISIDCTDCPIFEPWPWNSKWYSQKTNGPALKYEVAVCIKTGFIVWINGPFEASVRDPDIFRQGLSKELAYDECVEADNGYSIKEECTATRQLKLPGAGWNHKERKSKSNARCRQERINGKLKIFCVLTSYFRHTNPRNRGLGMPERHKMCFTAIAVITQVKMEAGETVSDYDKYDVNYF